MILKIQQNRIELVARPAASSLPLEVSPRWVCSEDTPGPPSHPGSALAVCRSSRRRRTPCHRLCSGASFWPQWTWPRSSCRGWRLSRGSKKATLFPASVVPQTVRPRELVCRSGHYLNYILSFCNQQSMWKKFPKKSQKKNKKKLQFKKIKKTFSKNLIKESKISKTIKKYQKIKTNVHFS